VARREIETARRKQAEFVLGTTAVPPQAYWMNPFEIDVWLVDPSEALAEFIGEVAPAETLVWGEWPDPVDDGERGITLKLVDDDGVLRRHAY
jgi:hypothetical protein